MARGHQQYRNIVSSDAKADPKDIWELVRDPHFVATMMSLVFSLGVFMYFFFKLMQSIREDYRKGKVAKEEYARRAAAGEFDDDDDDEDRAAQDGGKQQRATGDGLRRNDDAESGVAHRERLVAFYKQHAPDRVGNVDEVLRQFTGREALMWAALRHKYLAPVAASGGATSDAALAAQRKRIADEKAAAEAAQGASSAVKQGATSTTKPVVAAGTAVSGNRKRTGSDRDNDDDQTAGSGAVGGSATSAGGAASTLAVKDGSDGMRKRRDRASKEA